MTVLNISVFGIPWQGQANWIYRTGNELGYTPHFTLHSLDKWISSMIMKIHGSLVVRTLTISWRFTSKYRQPLHKHVRSASERCVGPWLPKGSFITRHRWLQPTDPWNHIDRADFSSGCWIRLWISFIHPGVAICLYVASIVIFGFLAPIGVNLIQPTCKAAHGISITGLLYPQVSNQDSINHQDTKDIITTECTVKNSWIPVILIK